MKTDLDPNEDDAGILWAEIHNLRAAIQGPDGFASWQDAATAERIRRVRAEKELAALTAPEQSPANAPAAPTSGEPAPPNSLPDWDECALRVANSEHVAKRVAGGGYGADDDVKLANELHRFIHEYDDADPYRSAWFMHRLERLIEWARATPPAWQPIETAPRDGSTFLCWVSAVLYGETDEGQQYQEDVSQADFCQWQSFEEAPDGGWFEPCCGQIGDSQGVTHWMPLPAAPGATPPSAAQAEGADEAAEYCGLSFSQAKSNILALPLPDVQGLAISLLIQNRMLLKHGGFPALTAAPEKATPPSPQQAAQGAMEVQPDGSVHFEEYRPQQAAQGGERETNLPRSIWLNDMGTEQKLSFKPISGAHEHHEYTARAAQGEPQGLPAWLRAMATHAATADDAKCIEQWADAVARAAQGGREGLTEEQIKGVCAEIFLYDHDSQLDYDVTIARAIERAHGITTPAGDTND